MIPKFRVWFEREDFEHDENYMRDVFKIEYINKTMIEINDSYIFNPLTNVADGIYAPAKLFLMQSTGLYDMNSVEIYEGDIVALDVLTYKTTIKVIDNLYDAFVLDNNVDSSDYIEVVGNKFEHPHLLEGADE